MARAAPLRCVELTPDRWPALEALFGPRGACAGCWCMWWRVEHGGALWKKTHGAPAKRQFKKLVTSGKAHGILAFAGDRAVGWCAFGPREDFPRLDTVRAYKQTEKPVGLWSINCFFIDKDHRRRGVARALLAAALAACKRHGARVIEGYPVAANKKLGATLAWTGPRNIFDERGFREVPTPPTSKPLVRLRLRGSSA
jgi:GNAT superfamily N-acetyltransferase